MPFFFTSEIVTNIACYHSEKEKWNKNKRIISLYNITQQVQFHMNRMVKVFQETIPGSNRFVYWPASNEFIALDHKPAHPKKAVEEWQAKLDKINEDWFHWQQAWNHGAKEPMLTPEDLGPEMIEAILDYVYIEEDFNSGEGLVDVQYQISNNFNTREHGRYTIVKIFEAYKKIKGGQV